MCSPGSAGVHLVDRWRMQIVLSDLVITSSALDCEHVMNSIPNTD